MAYDITQPTDTTKIRNLGDVIRPNWVAIEDADTTFQPKAINLTDRTVSGPSDDPAAIATAYELYCRQDAEGNPELFGISSLSNIIQFTKGAVSIGANGETSLPGGVMIKWGSASANGDTALTFIGTFGLTDFPNNCWGVIAQPVGSVPGVVNDYVYTSSPAVTGFTATGTRRITLAASPANFFWMAIGN